MNPTQEPHLWYLFLFFVNGRCAASKDSSRLMELCANGHESSGVNLSIYSLLFQVHPPPHSQKPGGPSVVELLCADDSAFHVLLSPFDLQTQAGFGM